MAIRLFIADTDPTFIANVVGCVSAARGIEVAGYATDGAQALAQIARLHPNVLLTDLQLPSLDGFSLIERIQKMRHPAACIACTRFYSDFMQIGARESGACMFLYKPIHLDGLPRIIAGCWEESRKRDTAVGAVAGAVTKQDAIRLRALMSRLGFPPWLNGSLYLTEAVLHLRGNASLINNLSKGLYAELASQLGTSPARIERSLRNAIDNAYRNGALRDYFPARPSNRAFIRFLLNQLDA